MAQYLADEIGHDQLLLKDLESLGVSLSRVEETEPFFSTKLLISYIRWSIDRDGALPCLLWNWFVEWYSDTYNSGVVKRVGQTLGLTSVKGMMTHLKIDEELDHAVFLDREIESCYRDRPDKVHQYLREYCSLVERYYQELLV